MFIFYSETSTRRTVGRRIRIGRLAGRSEVAGHQVAPLVVDVLDEAHPLEVEDPYGLSKVINERTAAMFARRSGATIAALRFGWILSRDEARSEAERFAGDPDRNRTALWGYIDERDAASAVLAAIDAPPFGFAAMNIIGHDTLATIPTMDALKRFAPEVELRAEIDGYDSAFSTERAYRLIGWAPLHSWRDAG